MKNLFYSTVFVFFTLAAHGQVEIGGFYANPNAAFSKYSYQHTGGMQLQMLFKMAPNRTYLGGGFQYINLYNHSFRFEGDITMRDGRYNTVWPLKLRVNNRLTYFDFSVVGRHYFVENQALNPFFEGRVGWGIFTSATSFLNSSPTSGRDVQFNEVNFPSVTHNTGHALMLNLGMGLQWRIKERVYINFTAHYLTTSVARFYGKDFLGAVELDINRSVSGDFDLENPNHLNVMTPEGINPVRRALQALQLGVQVGFDF
jgi:hypothetical protein